MRILLLMAGFTAVLCFGAAVMTAMMFARWKREESPLTFWEFAQRQMESDWQ